MKKRALRESRSDTAQRTELGRLVKKGDFTQEDFEATCSRALYGSPKVRAEAFGVLARRCPREGMEVAFGYLAARGQCVLARGDAGLDALEFIRACSSEPEHAARAAELLATLPKLGPLADSLVAAGEPEQVETAGAASAATESETYRQLRGNLADGGDLGGLLVSKAAQRRVDRVWTRVASLALREDPNVEVRCAALKYFSRHAPDRLASERIDAILLGHPLSYGEPTPDERKAAAHAFAAHTKPEDAPQHARFLEGLAHRSPRDLARVFRSVADGLRDPSPRHPLEIT